MILPNDQDGTSAPAQALFPMGCLMSTPAAMAALTLEEMAWGLARHLSGDWGDLDAEDVRENEFSLKEGFRLFSVYHGANGTKFWIITESDRSVTTILLPSDY
jgi:hypothetical protein